MRIKCDGVKHWQRTWNIMCSTKHGGLFWLWPDFLAVVTWIDLRSMWSPGLVTHVLWDIKSFTLFFLIFSSPCPKCQFSSPWSYNTIISQMLHLNSNWKISPLLQILNPSMVPSGNALPHSINSRVSIFFQSFITIFSSLISLLSCSYIFFCPISRCDFSKSDAVCKSGAGSWVNNML